MRKIFLFIILGVIAMSVIVGIGISLKPLEQRTSFLSELGRKIPLKKGVSTVFEALTRVKVPSLPQKITQRPWKEDLFLTRLLVRYLNNYPRDWEYIGKILTAYQEIKKGRIVIRECCPQKDLGPKKGVSSDILSCKFPGYYKKEFENVFKNRVRENWDNSGNWTNDWEQINDATSYAPSLLYKCAEREKNPELKRRANKTVDYEISLIDKIIYGRGEQMRFL